MDKMIYKMINNNKKYIQDLKFYQMHILTTQKIMKK